MSRPPSLSPAQRRALSQAFGPAVRFDVPLAPYTSARIGGPADALLTVNDRDALANAVAWLWAHDMPFWILGGGSNVLVADVGVRGVVLLNRARRIVTGVHEQGTAWIRAASGASLSTVARRAVVAGWQGLEWAVGIPGTVGGAVVGNAGAFGGEIGAVLLEAVVLQRRRDKPALIPMRARDLGFAYRSSALKRGAIHGVVLEATFGPLMPVADPAALRRVVTENQERRRRTQPPGASMGSMFKNPPDDAAGRLIDAAGLKGARRGDAEISTLHANFFLNRGQARARDVWALMVLARREVFRQFGVLLEPEIELVGAWDPAMLTMLYGPPDAR